MNSLLAAATGTDGFLSRVRPHLPQLPVSRFHALVQPLHRRRPAGCHRRPPVQPRPVAPGAVARRHFHRGNPRAGPRLLRLGLSCRLPRGHRGLRPGKGKQDNQSKQGEQGGKGPVRLPPVRRPGGGPADVDLFSSKPYPSRTRWSCSSGRCTCCGRARAYRSC